MVFSENSVFLPIEKAHLTFTEMKYYRESEKWSKKLYGNRVGLKLLNSVLFLLKDTVVKTLMCCIPSKLFRPFSKPKKKFFPGLT